MLSLRNKSVNVSRHDLLISLCLDVEGFRAFFKNEWSWSAPFNASFAATKSYIEGHH